MKTNALHELLDAIVAKPHDDDARLVYADALTSGGDPRGEFIVVQVALAKLGVASVEDIIQAPLEDSDAVRAGALLRRQNELFAEHGRAWVHALFPSENAGEVDHLSAGFRRGFIHHVSIDGERASSLVAQLAEGKSPTPPLESIRINGDFEVDRLLRSRAKPLHHVREITIRNTIAQLTFQHLIGATPALERIFDQHYGTNTLGAHIEVAASTSLTAVSLKGLTPDLVARASCLRSVTYLDLSSCHQHALEFLDASICPELQEVCLSSGFESNSVTFDVTAALKSKRPPPKLKKLRFEGDRGESLANVLDSKIGSTLEEITTDSGKLTKRVADVMMMATPSITKASFGSWALPSLAAFVTRTTTGRTTGFEKLSVRVEESIDEETLVTFLMQNPTLRHLKLGGRHYRPRHEGPLLETIARSSPSGLRSLSLSEWDLTNDDQVRVLLSSPQLSSLRGLQLQYCAMGDGGARAVTEASMPSLVSIDLSNNGIGGRGMRAFLSSSKERFPALASLRIGMSRVDEESYAAASQALGPLFTYQRHDYKGADWQGGALRSAKREELKIVWPFTASTETELLTPAVADHLATLKDDADGHILEFQVVRWDRDPWELIEAKLVGPQYQHADPPFTLEIHIERYQDERHIVIAYFLRERHAIRSALERITAHLRKLSAVKSRVVDEVLDCLGNTIGGERDASLDMLADRERGRWRS